MADEDGDISFAVTARGVSHRFAATAPALVDIDLALRRGERDETR